MNCHSFHDIPHLGNICFLSWQQDTSVPDRHIYINLFILSQYQYEQYIYMNSKIVTNQFDGIRKDTQ